MSLLEIDDLEVSYGRVRATHGISLRLEAGEILALVGANGAGKSSTLKAIMGMAPVTRGEIRFAGAVLARLRPSEIVRRKVAYSPEGRRVFPMLSVRDNLRVGATTLPKDEIEPRMAQMFEYFPRLRERHDQLAGSLSGGEQQMLAIARALMARPKLFLLDEPSLGLAPVIVQQIGALLGEIQQAEQLAVILAEQNAVWAMRIAQRTAVVEVGRIAIEGSSETLRANPEIRRAYLGT
jgi:branched-chain amino acid transport system ATP-binding protein